MSDLIPDPTEPGTYIAGDATEYTEEQRTCPTCGRVCTMDAYDIGDGPEFACPDCEWCWGALGQPLTDGPIKALAELARTQLEGLEGR